MDSRISKNLYEFQMHLFEFVSHAGHRREGCVNLAITLTWTLRKNYFGIVDLLFHVVTNIDGRGLLAILVQQIVQKYIQ